MNILGSLYGRIREIAPTPPDLNVKIVSYLFICGEAAHCGGLRIAFRTTLLAILCVY